MMKQILLLAGLVMLIGACSTTAESTIAPSQPTQQAAAENIATPTQERFGAPAQSADNSAAYNGPDWATIPLTDARTGEPFTLADYAGKTLFVEPMATWCTNCRHQIPNVELARTQLDSNQYVFVGLSVAENVDNATLASYVDGQGWNFVFAVAPEALVQGLVDTFGRTAVTPPSTPHFIIQADGTLSEMYTGSHSADELITELKAASGA